MTFTHGANTSGYQYYGCRCDACCWAYLRRRKEIRHIGKPRLVDSIGATRRVRALQAIGWTLDDIVDASDIPRSVLSVLSRGAQKTVQLDTFERIADAYDSMSADIGPGEITIERATKKGWATPLAWDYEEGSPHNIDDPRAKPYKAPRRPDRAIVDEVIVLRAMAGQKVDANMSERFEITRRWLRDGRSQAELTRIQGWRVDRYKEAS